MNGNDFCNHVQVPLDLFVGNVPKFPDRLRVYLLLCHFDRELDYGSIGRILDLSIANVKTRCAELVADGLVDRLGGKARVKITGLPDADAIRLRAFQGVMKKRESRNGDHQIQVPLKRSRQKLNEALASSLKYRFTDEEFAFLQEHKALTELQFWSKTLPAKCTAVGLVEAFLRDYPELDAKESAVIWCVRGAMAYGRRIGKLTGWLLALLPEWRKANNNLRARWDERDRSALPTLAERLGLATVAAATPDDDEVGEWVDDVLDDEAA